MRFLYTQSNLKDINTENTLIELKPVLLVSIENETEELTLQDLHNFLEQHPEVPLDTALVVSTEAARREKNEREKRFENQYINHLRLSWRNK